MSLDREHLQCHYDMVTCVYLLGTAPRVRRERELQVERRREGRRKQVKGEMETKITVHCV